MVYQKSADMTEIIIFLVLVTLVIVVFALGAFFHGAVFMMGFAPFVGAIGIFWVLFWIMLLVLFFRWMFGLGGNRRAWYREERAEWIAKERYAKGEISKKEFEEIMKKLHEY
ncbi:MAG: SHOCT domain-containing protein [Candidatus Micrarchaeia archaeon]